MWRVLIGADADDQRDAAFLSSGAACRRSQRDKRSDNKNGKRAAMFAADVQKDHFITSTASLASAISRAGNRSELACDFIQPADRQRFKILRLQFVRQAQPDFAVGHRGRRPPRCRPACQSGCAKDLPSGGRDLDPFAGVQERIRLETVGEDTARRCPCVLVVAIDICIAASVAPTTTIVSPIRYVGLWAARACSSPAAAVRDGRRQARRRWRGGSRIGGLAATGVAARRFGDPGLDSQHAII